MNGPDPAAKAPASGDEQRRAAMPFGRFDADGSIASQAVRRLRGPRVAVDPTQPVAVWDELEVERPTRAVPTRVVILAGAECRFTCAMCDLWRHTLPGPTGRGRLPLQIRLALERPWAQADPSRRWIKLYNGSNFFDPRAVPPEDLPAIADAVAAFARVVVENHPCLVDDRVPRFRDRCGPRLEVAMGLETVHEEVLPRLGKRMTLDDFTAACARLRGWDIDIRSFVLLGLPWSASGEAVEWCARSVAFALARGVRHVSVVPTRSGNGLLDRLARRGDFTPPDAAMVERAAARVVDAAARPSGAPSSVVTVDLWDWPRLVGTCPACRVPRRARLERMNHAQAVLPPLAIDCGCTA
jgi:radical SAM enzyme (TIGR01210 family)